MQVEHTEYTMIYCENASLESLDFKKFLKRMQQAICMNDWKATELYLVAVKNRIIEILFYYILIKAHFVIFACLK
jgi:hypothetical protein